MSATPTPDDYPLFEHMQREHGLTLLESELHEIKLAAGLDKLEAERGRLRAGIEAEIAWLEERRNAAGVTTLGMVQEGLRRVLGEDRTYGTDRTNMSCGDDAAPRCMLCFAVNFNGCMLCDACATTPCRHGNPRHECDACDHESDLEFDAARERGAR